MAILPDSGSGLISGYRHGTVAGLWVREVDPTDGKRPHLILTGVIKGVGDNAIDTTANLYAHGCMLTQVDGVTGLSAQWINVGTAASPSWQRWQDQ